MILRKNQQSNAGTILLLTLIILSAIVAIAIELHIIAHNMIRREQTSLDITKLRLLAADAVFFMAQRLALDENFLCDSTNELWAQAYSNNFNDGTKIIAITIDENRFFDVNNLAMQANFKIFRQPIEILIDLFAMNGINNSIELAQSVQDWIDINMEGFRESLFYTERYSNCVPPNTKMESPEELSFIFQANNILFSRMPEGLTLIPKQEMQATKINVNTASEKVLAAVLGPYAADIIVNISRRRETTPITSLTSLLPAKIASEAQLVLDVKSDYFSIIACAEHGEKLAKVYALLHREPTGNIKILRWLER